MADPILTIKLLPKTQQLISSMKGADELADSLIKEYGDKIAREIKELIREPISKDTGIGATGKSWRAVKHKKVSGGKGKASYIIYEDGSGANESIRRGIKPGEQGDMYELRTWAISKRLALKHPDTYKKDTGYSMYDSSRQGKRVDPSPVSYLSGKNKRRIRPYRKDEDKFTAAINAIWRALEDRGTNRPPDDPLMGAAWWFLHPSGQGRFDYVRFATETKRPRIRSILRDASSEIGSAIFRRILSGRGRGGLSTPFNISSRR